MMGERVVKDGERVEQQVEPDRREQQMKEGSADEGGI